MRGREKRKRGGIELADVKCNWDCCKHLNWETGYCECPDDVELANEDVEIEDEQGASGLENYLVCKNYEKAWHEGQSQKPAAGYAGI